MGIRTRGLDIKAGAAKLKADRAARAEAEAVIQRWNDQLSRGRDMLWSPTIRAALLAGTPWLDVFCPGLQDLPGDLRTVRLPAYASQQRPHDDGACRAMEATDSLAVETCCARDLSAA
jgi:hypothetical protein